MVTVMAGERRALAELVERHHGPLVGYLYRLLGGDRLLAEDLVQETFIKVIKQRSFQADRPFKPWLYMIATNLARDHYKSAATRHAATDECSLSMPDADPGPEEKVLAAEQKQEVAAALAQIQPEYRAALLLRFYGGMSLQEIATALDVPLGTVKSRLFTGCRRLRDMLANGHERV